MSRYYPRFAEKQIEKKLRTSGAVLIEGPKFCGKTTTSMRYAKSSIRLITNQAIELARLETRNILQGDIPRVIDEWQTVPDIWNEVRGWVDEHPGFGQFILTGSSTPADMERILHSGAGRITKVKMKPMSLAESEDSHASVSLKELFGSSDVSVYDENPDFDLADMARLICRGGWPLSVTCDQDIAVDVTHNYYSGLFNFEYSENQKFRNKNPDLMRMILKSYARNISSEASVQTIRADVIGNNNRTLDTKTMDDYLEALRDLFLIEDIEAWNPNLRSKTAVRTTATRHFVDTSVAAAALSISPNDLMNDLQTLGLFFEDLAVRDLKIYTGLLDGEVMHYRDARGLECDAVLHLSDGRWALCEIKLGGEKLVEEGAANLNKLSSIVDQKNMAFAMILTAVGPAYRRRDGIYVVPLNCLGA